MERLEYRLALTTVNVSTIAALQTAITAANAGDTIVLANGTYLNNAINITTSNITVEAATPGGVYLNGTNAITLDGNNDTVSGFQFTSGSITGNVVTVNGNYNSLTALNFNGYYAVHMVIILGQYNVLSDSNFQDKPAPNLVSHGGTGDMVQIIPSPTVVGYNTITSCSFQHMPGFGGDFGNECIRIGDDAYSTEASGTVVQYCFFEDTGLGDSEAISVKSQDNVLRYNTMYDNPDAMFSFRNGDDNVAYGNFFLASGGIRCKEANNIYIYNNYFGEAGINQDPSLPGSGTAPIYLEYYGTGYGDDFNVLYNTFYNCTASQIDAALTNCTWANNIFYAPTGTIFTGTDSGQSFAGNIYQGTLGISITSGMTDADPLLSLNSDDYYGLSASSPAIGASSASFPAVLSIANLNNDPNLLLDIQGQARPATVALKDVGCDQYTTGAITNRPLTLSEVGPSYLSATSLVFGSYVTGAYGATASLTATLTEAGLALANEVVSFSLNGTPVGTASTNANGLATLAGVNLAGIHAGNYASYVSAAFAGDGTFTASAAATSLAVSAAPLTIAANSQTKVYGAALPTLTVSYSGFVDRDTSASLTTQPTVSTLATAASPVTGGPYAILASAAVDPDYTIGYSAGSLTVTRATPSVTVADLGGIYSAATYPGAGAVAGVVNGVDNSPGPSLEGVAPTLSYFAGTSTTGATLSGAPTLAGTYTVLASFAGSTNYITGAANAVFTIGKAAPSLMLSDSGGTYSGSAFPATTASLEGVAPAVIYYSGTSASGTAMSAAPTAVGTYTVLASFAGSSDYASGTASATFTISQATPSLSVTDAGGSYTGFAFVASDLLAGVGSQATEAASLEGVTPTLVYYAGSSITGSSLTGAPSSAGTYSVLASFAGSADYAAAQSIPETFSIGQVPLIISANNLTKPYGASLPVLSTTYSGFVGSDTWASLTTQPVFSTTATAASHVAANPYPIGISAASDSNYTITYVSGSLTVTPAPLTITALDQTMTQGAALPTLTAGYAGFVNGDSAANLSAQPTLSTAATSTSPPSGSPYPITASGAVDPDYAIRYMPGSLTITSSVTVVSPTSSAAVLALRTSLTSFPVSWSGTAGNGGPIVSYNISVSMDGGAFIPWRTGTTLTSSTYVGAMGNTYGFISQATDTAGNVELAHTTADATITTTAHPWQNPSNALNVLGTGNLVVPGDALAVIDYLNTHSAGTALPATFPSGSFYVDVSGTGTVIPSDALQIIDFLNTHAATAAVEPAVTIPLTDFVNSASHSGSVPNSLTTVNSSVNGEFSLPLSTQSCGPFASPAVRAADIGPVNTNVPARSSFTALVAATSTGPLRSSVKPLTESASQSSRGRASVIDRLLSDTEVNWRDE